MNNTLQRGRGGLLHRGPLALWTLPLVLGLSACGGDGGGADASVSTPTIVSPTGPTITAALIKGPVSGASCTLRLPNGDKLTGTTVSGMATLGKTSVTGDASVECTGGTYTDEATGQTVSLGTSLRAGLSLNNSEQTAVITPLTEIALRVAGSNSGFKAQLNELANVLGFSPNSDLSTVVPSKSGSALAQEYQNALTAITQYQKRSGAVLGEFLDHYDTDTGGLTSAQRSAWVEALKDTGAGTAAMQARLQKVRMMGTVSGLAGKSLTLSYGSEAGMSKTLSADGAQTYFALDAGAAYTLSLTGVPSGMSCMFSNGSAPQGKLTGDDLGNIDIICSSGQATLGGKVSGLSANGGSVSLSSNTGEVLTLNADGAYNFKSPFAENASYSIKVQSPNTARCSVDWAQGKVLQASVDRAHVVCVPKTNGVLSKGVIRALDIVQSYSQPVGSPYQLLVPGRKAMVRAFIYRTGTENPAVSLKVKGVTKALNCPSVLPADATSPVGAPIHQYNNTGVCTAELSAAEVSSGLTLEVTADTHVRSFTPLVNTSNSRVQLKLIPLKIGSLQASISSQDLSDARHALLRNFPLKDISVTQSPAYTVTKVTGIPISSSQWSSILQELDNYREKAEPGVQGVYYYGVLPDSTVPGLQGMAYIGDGGGYYQTGIGLGQSKLQTMWATVLAHEFGHNMSLRHANCDAASASNVDPFWTQLLSPISWPGLSNGKLSPAALFDLPSYEANASNSQILAPDTTLSGGNYDLMSYCEGGWLSEYNYHKAASYLQVNSANVTTANTAASMRALQSNDYTRISGSIDSQKGVTLSPAGNTSQLQNVPNSGSHYALIKLADGRELQQYFTPVSIDHAPDVQHFALAVDTAGSAIVNISLYQGNQQILSPQSLP